MTEITVINKDWSILAAVRTALGDAAAGGSKLFAAVTVTTSPRQAEQCQFTATPAAILRYVTTTQQESPDEHLGCSVVLELTVAAKVDCGGSDESAALREILRLLAAARNAIGASPPADSCEWGDEDFFVRRLEFGQAEVDAAQHAPWALARLPIRIGYTLDSDTSH